MHHGDASSAFVFFTDYFVVFQSRISFILKIEANRFVDLLSI